MMEESSKQSQEIKKTLNDIWTISSKLCGIFRRWRTWKKIPSWVVTCSQVAGECRYLENSQASGIVGLLHKETQTCIYLPLLRIH